MHLYRISFREVIEDCIDLAEKKNTFIKNMYFNPASGVKLKTDYLYPGHGF